MVTREMISDSKRDTKDIIHNFGLLLAQVGITKMVVDHFSKLVPTNTLIMTLLGQVLGNHTCFPSKPITHGTMDFEFNKLDNTSLQKTIIAYPSSMLS